MRAPPRAASTLPTSGLMGPTYTQSRSAPGDETIEEGVGFEPTYSSRIPRSAVLSATPPDLMSSCDGGTRRAFRPCRTGRTRTCDLLIPDQLLLPLSYSPCGMRLVEPSLAEQDSNLHLPVRRLVFCQLNYPRMIGASGVLSTTSPCVFTQYFRGCWVTE